VTLLTDRILIELLDAAPDAMVSFDRDGTIVMANLQARMLFGYRREEMIGKPIESLVPIEFEKNREASTGILVAAQHFDGHEFLAEISLSTILNGDNPIVTATIRDVSARSELEAERVRVKSEAERVRLFVEAERITAEREKSVAEGVRLFVEAERIKAEGEKSVAEEIRLEAEAALVKAKGEKSVAEGVRLEAEAALVKAKGEKSVAEGVRLEAEEVRLEAEAALITAKGEKSVAEKVRLVAEAELITAEGEKAVAERVRLEAEVQRIRAEAEKTEAERVRLEAEVQRVKAEVEKTEAERVRLEAEVVLERLQGQLHQSQRMESLGQLAGGVAHDFNNLLAVILNYAAFVMEELTAAVAIEEQSKWEGSLNDVKQIQVAAERASVLTHQLLAFARREVIQARPLSFNTAITNIEEILRRTIGEQIELLITLEPNLAMVVADPGHIEQIILNLAINARDAMPSGGTLSIETSTRFVTEAEWSMFGAPEGSYICVRISDNGAGMSPEVRERAFEPFFTTKPRGEGSGLGLATVYGIVLQTGGFTKIYSDEGVGTTITVCLPVDPHQVDVAEHDEGSKVNTPQGNETVLVVDDEEGLREVTRRILVRNGYTVMVASGGESAIKITTEYEGKIDLLLTDVIMPNMQGPTVAKEIKKLVPGIRVLFMSGHAQPVLEAESVIGTQFQLVEKPFDQSMLLKSVRDVLDADLKTMTQKK
jgi:PAS domain S-box-containing protein